VWGREGRVCSTLAGRYQELLDWQKMTPFTSLFLGDFFGGGGSKADFLFLKPLLWQLIQMREDIYMAVATYIAKYNWSLV
jgi:hypothetical protein